MSNQETVSNTQVRIRKVPRFLPFMITFGVIGVIVGAGLGLSIPADQRTAEPIVTYLIAYLGGIGVVLGIVTTLILDRIGLAKAKRVEATKIEQ
ncbi:MAG: hypothetical protein RL100_752 [Actinomycetota bacterium]|jgi:enoyl-CoA hydratase/carnithine racemase